MDLRSFKPQPETPAARTDQLLESNYQKFLKWATTLTRGDAAKAEEIVQEFCLYLALTKPDLRNVANLDGYFYISLRNLYQSSLARSAREAVRFVSVAEFDSIRIALAGNHGGDTLERQNDLRRICNYALWRKNQSKGFCYFILHFFHGYFRREVAEMAGVPLSAIYNKLHTARSEVKVHLQDNGKMRVLSQTAPPEPSLLWRKIPEADFFKELRTAILSARSSSCLPEGELLARYRTSCIKPISRALLSHIVSCERCLAIVDRHFQRPMLDDREPLDSTSTREDSTGKQKKHMDAMKSSTFLRMVRSRLQQTYEHRPRTLSIAVNGKIVASHDVQGKHSSLAARIESPEKAQFVEVFSEQDIRLALLPVGAPPPEGEHSVVQRVELSDDRWLELNLVFDGMGLNSEVAYFDPVLAIATDDADTEEEQDPEPDLDAQEDTPIPHPPPRAEERHRKRRVWNWPHILLPSPVLSWALLLIAVSSVAGYFLYRHAHRPMDAQQILRRSTNIETAALRGKTEHQLLKIEEVSDTGQILRRGTVDVWKDGNGRRYLRELYDAGHHAVAAEWRVHQARHTAHVRGKTTGIAELPWSRDVSVRAFNAMATRPPQLRRLGENYALTVKGPFHNQPHLVSATLVVNRRLLFVQEALRFRRKAQVYELRFLQTAHSYHPSGSVPDSNFEPAQQLLQSQQKSRHSARHLLRRQASPSQLAELEIGVLYQLSQMGADTGQPIEIQPTADGHLRVLGAITSNALRQKIVSRLRALPNHRYLEISLASQNSAATENISSLHDRSEKLDVYDVGGSTPIAESLVRRHFQKQGLTGTALSSAASKFSSTALTLSQHALQNSYALDRLSRVFSLAKPNTISPRSLSHWTSMVSKHASLLGAQMHSLRAQLQSILPAPENENAPTPTAKAITSTAQFAQSAKLLLQNVQAVNHNLNQAFASGPAGNQGKSAADFVASTINMLPINDAARMETLAQHLSRAEAADTMTTKPQHHGTAVTPQ